MTGAAYGAIPAHRAVDDRQAVADAVRAELKQVERERDTLIRFALAPGWNWFHDLPDPWDNPDAYDVALTTGDRLARQMRAAFEAAPSLDELLRGAL